MLEKRQKLLLLERRERPPETAEHKAAKAGYVEIRAEQLLKARQSLLRRGASGHRLQLVTQIIDERGRIHASRSRHWQRQAPGNKDHGKSLE